ncbi:hypothetical protein JOD43_000545 [Pullulanibacillus pueri]|uniref:DUF4878 domain-containing protein n=1 Tax=Pullulanibacillus pueri TaxID=1437324 RepID=A0A8J2ZS31_9BACL|nr:hypothetical protein [Pullulanibacillus pueri]MBM7680386.1 hypothetical protein [Pullulanibacillus pueri]GGH75327.1 hypothetical protein GCM10007096_04440 [Pullulanibacillus pueri]
MAAKKKGSLFLLILILLLGAFLGTCYGYKHLPRQKAISAVKEFYDAEQEGDYATAWEMFHPLMKKRFNQTEYIQARSKIYLEDLGIKTFSYKVTDTKHLDHWRMTSQDSSLKDVYRVTVEQSFKGIFGKTRIEKDFYVTETKGDYKILWQY